MISKINVLMILKGETEDMNLNRIAKEAHQTAVEHGFWEPEPTFGELIALMHSELSEALEAFREGQLMVWHVCYAPDSIYECEEHQECKETCECREAKPEGIAVELADCIIRILDWAGHEGTEFKPVPIARDCVCEKTGEIIAECHWMISKAYENRNHPAVADSYLNRCVSYILAWAKENELDMYAIIREKMDYNKTRPYRHGGKRL